MSDPIDVPQLPPEWPSDSDWTGYLGDWFTTSSWQNLQEFLASERERGPVFPPTESVFRALALTHYRDTRVVLLGQDPYHGHGQAHGLCFSVPAETPFPPSLRNVFKERKSDVGLPLPDHGDLSHWARQGVLLLNTVLTVREGSPQSHRGQGWEQFTDLVISALDQHPRPLVFVLWGKAAAAKAARIGERHDVVKAPHPSPLSAHRGFLGSRPFSSINEHLRDQGDRPIDW